MQKKRNFQKKFTKYQKKEKRTEKLQGDEQEGLIVAHFGAFLEVEDTKGNIIRCHQRKNFQSTATGDRVLWRLEKDNTGILVALLPRKTVLERPEKSNRTKLIAANLDAIVIVTAPPPIFSTRLLDRYLVAAENLKIHPIIVLNKIDLLDPPDFEVMQEYFAVYKKIGYTVIYSSIYKPNGLQDLGDALTHQTAVLVGVSGVGKSSIIASFTGLNNIMIGNIAMSESGKHTTTTARLYHIPKDGSLIDSPGVREFALWHLPKDQILQGFIDFQPYLGYCKFRNCEHQSEPGCALRQAVSDKKISEERWASYQEICGQNK